MFFVVNYLHKNPILDVWQGSEYESVSVLFNSCNAVHWNPNKQFLRIFFKNMVMLLPSKYLPVEKWAIDGNT